MTQPQRQYVALLRAINVGGFSIIKMADLKIAFENMKFRDVTTHIQTGNVIFKSGETDTARLARQIEKALATSLGYEGTVFVLTPEELQDAAANNPFDPERLDKEQRCHLMFLSSEPSAAQLDAFMALEGEEYRFAVRGKVLYYAYSREFDGSRRRTINFEKVLGTTGTARTWKVVNKLIELAAQ